MEYCCETGTFLFVQVLYVEFKVKTQGKVATAIFNKKTHPWDENNPGTFDISNKGSLKKINNQL
jgi:hypothetical protein